MAASGRPNFIAVGGGGVRGQSAGGHPPRLVARHQRCAAAQRRGVHPLFQRLRPVTHGDGLSEALVPWRPVGVWCRSPAWTTPAAPAPQCQHPAAGRHVRSWTWRSGRQPEGITRRRELEACAWSWRRAGGARSWWRGGHASDSTLGQLVWCVGGWGPDGIFLCVCVCVTCMFRGW